MNCQFASLHSANGQWPMPSARQSRLGGVEVALAVEVACAGERVAGLEVLGNGGVEQRALRVAQVVEFGLCTRLGGVSDDAGFVSRMTHFSGASGKPSHSCSAQNMRYC